MKMTINQNKILPGVTARDYCASVGKGLHEYVMEGVHTEHTGADVLEIFRKAVPDDAEVVVNYSSYSTAINPHFCVDTAMGTALIPREKRSVRE